MDTAELPTTLMTFEETWKALRITERTLRGWIMVGTIPCIKMGKRVMFKRTIVERIQEFGTEPKTSPRKSAPRSIRSAGKSAAA